MRNLAFIGSTALGIAIGAIIFSPTPASSQGVPVIDVQAFAQQIKAFAQQLKQLAAETGILDAVSAIQTVTNAINDGINDINKALGVGTYGDVQTLLRLGFTQEANYQKAQIGAQEQIQDASNTANARFLRDMRNAQIRDEHTPSPAACAAIDGGVSTQQAAIQAFAVGAAISYIHDRRGEAWPGMPSHLGQAQGAQSMAAAHNNAYCNADDAAANLCTLSANPDADQQASSLFGPGTYPTQPALNAAKDYATTLIETVAPAALRGDQLASAAGQDAAVRRRAYNSRMSLAQQFVDGIVGMQTPSVPLTALQQQYLRNVGLPVQTAGSWLQALQIEAERRVSDLTWNASNQSNPPATVVREIASQLALTNYLLFQIFSATLKHAAISATHLATDVEHNFTPAVQMPTPSIAAN